MEKKQINEEILFTFGTDYSKRMNLDVTGARSSIFPTPGLLDILYPLDLSCCLTSQQSQWWFTPLSAVPKSLLPLPPPLLMCLLAQTALLLLGYDGHSVF